MKYVSPAFRKLGSREIVSIGYQRVKYHMIFDVKMEYFCCKAILVAVGHMPDPPSTIAYVGVVSRETVRIALILAALNGFPMKLVEIQNAYIMAPVKENI